MHSPEYYLTHYFRLLFEKNGLKWDSDNSTEMTCLAEAITTPLEKRLTEIEHAYLEERKLLEEAFRRLLILENKSAGASATGSTAMTGMTLREAKAQQRRYQRQGCTTWLISNIFSGEERLGFQYSVAVLDKDGTEHILQRADERVGGTRTVTIESQQRL